MPSILFHKKAAAFLYRASMQGAILLTNKQMCSELRDELDISRSEFDAIVQYLFEIELISIDQKNGKVWIKLTTKGESAAEQSLVS